MSRTSALLKDLVAQQFDWAGWETLIRANGVVIDRPYGSHHPHFPDIIYPLNYGYVNGTSSGDGDEVDIFVGSATNSLVGLLITMDYRREDQEVKLLFNCTPEEIYLVHGFINFDRQLMEGLLVLRRPMVMLWSEVAL